MTDVPGLSRARRQIQAIPAAVRERLKKANREGVQSVAAAVRPRATRLSQRLGRTVGWSEGLPPAVAATGAFRLKAKNLNRFERALNDEGLLFTAYEGDNFAFWARWMEKGTRAGPRDITPKRDRVYARGKRVENRRRIINHPGTKARPHFYPVVRMMRRQINNRANREIRRGIKEALKFS